MKSNTVFTNSPVIDHGDILILSVKPQIVPQILPELKNSNKLLLSIAMGVPLATLERVTSFDVEKRTAKIIHNSIYKLFTKRV